MLHYLLVYCFCTPVASTTHHHPPTTTIPIIRLRMKPLASEFLTIMRGDAVACSATSWEYFYDTSPATIQHCLYHA